MSNQWDTVYYVGVTNDLYRRVNEHRKKTNNCFTSRYNITKLIYYEAYDTPYDAITREKQIKKWRREKKLWLIKEENPSLQDISWQIMERDDLGDASAGSA